MLRHDDDAGTGDFAILAYRKLHPLKIIGIDISEGMMKIFSIWRGENAFGKYRKENEAKKRTGIGENAIKYIGESVSFKTNAYLCNDNYFFLLPKTSNKNEKNFSFRHRYDDCNDGSM